MAVTPFRPATDTWFREAFKRATTIQSRGWPAIRASRHSLLIAPTGSGKTLAAFLSALDRLAGEALPEPRTGYSVIYISPLKALATDIERNLRAPLIGIAQTAGRLGEPAREPVVHIRTGDTPQSERRSQAREPGDILVTTPESLYLLLGSKAAENLESVHTVIIDEVHALAGNKRGAHLTLSLERLAESCGQDPQRIGLSATVHPVEVARGFLGGDRDVEVIDAAEPPRLDLEILAPEEPPAAHATPTTEPPKGAQAIRSGSILGGGLQPGHRDTPRRGRRPRRAPGAAPAGRDPGTPLDHRVREQSWPVRTPGAAHQQGLARAATRGGPTAPRTWWPPTTAASPTSVAPRSRAGSRPTACAASSPPARWSWGSTWARSTW